MMKQARVGVVLTAVLVLSVSAMYAQGVGGISPRAFGDKSLRAPVATFALLPLTSNVVNDTRMVIDELTWHVWDGTALALTESGTTLANDFDAATFTGDGKIECNISFVPSSTGTFIPRFFQAAHTAGTLSLYQGSHCYLFDFP